jgi:hypothetical protein
VVALGPQVWRALVAHGLTVAALAAAEERGLGGLVVLPRAAGLPVEARGRDGPSLLTLAGEDEWPPHWEAEA